MAKMKIRKGDRVVVLQGKDRGREGVVVAPFPLTERCSSTASTSAQAPEGHRRHHAGRHHRQGHAHRCLVKVAVISPGDGKPTKVGYRNDPDGTKVRICKRTGVDLP